MLTDLPPKKGAVEKTPSGLERWEQQVATAPAPEEGFVALVLERFGDRVDLIEHMLGQCIEEIAALRGAGGATGEDEGDDKEPAPTLGDRIAALEDRLILGFGALSAHLDKAAAPGSPQTGISEADRLAAQMQTRLDQMECRLGAIAARPAPRPDLSDQHLRTAQILTAISTISRRQEAVMSQIEDRLATFSAEQAQLAATGDLTELKAQMDSRLERLETRLGDVVSEGQHNVQKMANISRAFDRNSKKVLTRLDAIPAALDLDIQNLATQLCTAVQDSLAAAHPSPTPTRDDIAPDLLHSLRLAMAEVLAEQARQSVTDTLGQSLPSGSEVDVHAEGEELGKGRTS